MFVVTGANGFIGSVLIGELRRNFPASRLIAVDPISISERPQYLRPKPDVEFMNHDQIFSLSPNELSEVRGIFHMGACSDTTETNKIYLQENNVDYSIKIFELCRRFQIPLLYASSGAVYGLGEHGFGDDIDPQILQPLNLYGWSKTEFDRWVLKQSSAPPRCYGLRFFNVYGPNEYHKGHMASLVYKAFQQIREKGSLRLFKSHNPKYRDGEQLRDFVYVKDICRWMIEIWQNPLFRSGIYNLGFGKARTWLDLATAVFSNMQKPVDIDWIETPENLRAQYQYFTEAKMDRAFSAGLSRPEFALERGVRDYVVDYLLKDERIL